MFYIFLLYAFLVPFEYIQAKFPTGPTGINYANIMMASMIIFWVYRRAAKGQGLALKTPLNLALPAFLVFTYFGMVLSSMSYGEAHSAFALSSPAVSHFLQFLNSYLFFFFAANLIDSRKQMRWVLLTLAFAAPWVFRVFFNQLQSVLVWHYSNGLRISGPFIWIGSNELGAFMLYSAVMLGLLAFFPFKLWKKCFFALAGVCYVYGVLFSYSRATQLSFVVCCVIVASIRYRWLLFLMVVLAVTSSAWLPPSVTDRWEMTRTETGELESSAQSREDFWAFAVELWQDNPVIGVGVGAFIILNEAKMDTHNIYYRILCEQGLVGISLFMLTWYLILSMSYRLWKKAPHPFDRHYGFCLMIATIGLMVANFFGDRYTHLAMIGHYWVFVGIAARLYANMNGEELLEDDEGLVPAAWTPIPAIKHDNSSAPAPGLNVLRPVFARLPFRKPLAGPGPITARNSQKIEPSPTAPASKRAQPLLNIVGKDARASKGTRIVSRDTGGAGK